MKNSCMPNIKSGVTISAFFCLLVAGFSQTSAINKHFTNCNVNGSITVYDYQNQLWIYSDEIDSKKETLPASTFKIFNSLVALEEKVVKDENEVIKWDNIDRGNKNWNADTDLKNAFKNSTLWFYQEIARRVGKDKYQDYLNRSSFGNKTIGKDVDKFWIDGSLRISPVNQIKILVDLYENKLPFSIEVQNKVKEIMVYESTDKYTIRAKTGWGFEDHLEIGWWVGYIEVNKQFFFFATRITLPEGTKNDNFGNCRKTITYDILKEMNI